jgi:hypothetical protein
LVPSLQEHAIVALPNTHIDSGRPNARRQWTLLVVAEQLASLDSPRLPDEMKMANCRDLQFDDGLYSWNSVSRTMTRFTNLQGNPNVIIY